MENYNDLGTSALAHYVMHRKIIIDLFEKAISVDKSTGKYPLEEVLHNIVFPMRSDDRKILYSQQNLWLIDERLTFYTSITSDKTLKSHDGLRVDSKLRPDILIFDQKTLFAEEADFSNPIQCIVLVEFKRPQRGDYQQSPTEQIFEQIAKIKEGSCLGPNGRPIKVASQSIPTFAYLICDITAPLEKKIQAVGATPTPDKRSFFGYNANYQTYFEVIDYSKLISDTKKRNRIFFEKLNLED